MVDASNATARKRLIGFIVVLAVVSIAYRLVYASGLANTAALYVGVPALLAIGLAMAPRSGTATGMLIKGSLLAVLIAAVILPEGILCLLFVVPLVTGIAAVVGTAIDYSRRHRDGQGPALMALALPLLLMSLEGVAGSPFDAHDSATASITVAATPAEVAAALAGPPRFDTPLPAFLRVGFNRPVGSTGSGLAVGDTRAIEFTGGNHDDHPLRLFGLTGHRGVDHHAEMHLRVEESGPGRVVFRIEHDGTMLSRWLRLDRAVVTWEPVPGDTTRTRVQWTLEYERLLYPTAYFAPLQRFGMDRAAGYLLQASVAAPLR
ncbi:MAG: hypothetical protein QOG43_292 [Actinomycetota bacterium]|jgi:hypothetical protein|nr:hypothetical protein [Actinomycetota bacterium]